MPSLKEMRKEKGYTVEEMADKMGVTSRTYYNYERHPEDLTLTKAVNLCRHLECSLEDIFLPTDVN